MTLFSLLLWFSKAPKFHFILAINLRTKQKFVVVLNVKVKRSVELHGHAGDHIFNIV